MQWIHLWLTRKIRSSLLSALVAAFATLFIGVLGATGVMHAIDLPYIVFVLLIYTCHVLAIFTGTVHAVKRTKKHGVFNGLRISISYGLLVALISYLVADIGSIAIAGLLFLAAMLIGILSGLWAMRRVKK